MFFETEYHRMPIHDMREIAENLDIDREGFELMRHTTHVSDLYDDDALESVYKPEIKTLLKDRFGASKVVIFDVTRRSDGGNGAIGSVFDDLDKIFNFNYSPLYLEVDGNFPNHPADPSDKKNFCLLYTSDAADE